MMDKMDLVILLTMLFAILLIAFLSTDGITKDETEWVEYKYNIVLNDMSIETYNKSYDELTHEQKEQMIRWYRISGHTNQKNNYVPFIVPIPT